MMLLKLFFRQSTMRHSMISRKTKTFHNIFQIKQKKTERKRKRKENIYHINSTDTQFFVCISADLVLIIYFSLLNLLHPTIEQKLL